MKLAVLGGSFNPLHLGHLKLAESVLNQFAYELILFTPVWKPPHKEMLGNAEADDRLAMLKRALKETGQTAFAVEPCELTRQGISYTTDTIDYLEQKYAACLEGKIGLIIGQDLAAGFSAWKQAASLSEKTNILLAKRPNAGESFFSYPHQLVENPLLDISSADIRQRIFEKKEWKHLVPASVYRYIKKRKLYGSL